MNNYYIVHSPCERKYLKNIPRGFMEHFSLFYAIDFLINYSCECFITASQKHKKIHISLVDCNTKKIIKRIK